MTASISARTIDALTAIATGLHDIADAVREAGRAGEGQAHAEMLQDRIDATLNLADQWEAAQKANRESLERGELAVLHIPDPKDFRYAATGCLDVPPVEAQIATQEPAGATQGGSGDSRVSGGSCARCGAGITLPADDPENREMAVCAPCEITVLKEGYRTARAQVEAIRAAIKREAAHGEAITRCNLVAERFQTVLDSVTAP